VIPRRWWKNNIKTYTLRNYDVRMLNSFASRIHRRVFVNTGIVTLTLVKSGEFLSQLW
jgi:hypothetical protein